MTDCETYTVQRGDTLSEIAQWFGVDMDMLASMNGIQDPNKISGSIPLPASERAS
ncbi:LysM domain-containing protein [Saccharopolyspora erythraea NRRL 2338]|uniref:LysM domain-containing protein n=1 Tax=Saccharopolyspora erythraea TaxID=1836 RepID=A0ABN1DPR5_SACER|nr:LysM domain-containing protein [Saccharopolyspora erythraea]EQD86078.1 hypothetical protein N599_11475 [Saccharopolyspora erythraea D]PFG97925.1 LysM domain-containing protein [Saccharopolyspora erythraea NRRL 2338]QRK88057.1 LysM peptidoglycan-binding domain-containing protein [Saccharopolyspora erythraea]